MEKKLKHLLQFLDIDSTTENLLAIAFSFIIILTTVAF